MPFTKGHPDYNTKESRIKNSLSHKGKKFSDEHKKNISKARIGMKLSENTKIKLNKLPQAFKKGQKAWNKDKEIPNICNEKHGNWRGSDVSYSALHSWIRRKLGTPGTCEHCGKSGLWGKEIHWANKDHKYKRNLKDWLRLCVRCHSNYDKKLCQI